MVTLSESAKEKFISGITSMEEILQYLKTTNNIII